MILAHLVALDQWDLRAPRAILVHRETRVLSVLLAPPVSVV